MDFDYKEEYKYPTNIILNITDACNLACVYCFVTQQPHFIDLKTTYDIIDWMYNNLQIKRKKNLHLENNFCQLTFFGGEPTLLFDDIIIPSINYCNTKYKNEFKFSITTNGTLLDQNKIEFLYNNNVSILLSIDGAKETQNKNRPCHNNIDNSFDLIYKNIPILLNYFPKVTFRSTIEENTVKYLFKNYLFAEEIGFKNYFATPNGRTKWQKENIEILQKETKKIFIHITNNFLNNKQSLNFDRIDEIFHFLLLEDINKIDNNFLSIPNFRNEYRCGLGTLGASVGYDGKIYGCQEQDSQNINSFFHIGDIYNGIDIKKHKQFLKKFNTSINPICENQELCKNCILKDVCKHLNGFNCPSQSYDLFKDFNIRDEIGCYWYQILAENCLIMQKVLVENNNLLFKDYLYTKCKYKNYFK